MKVKCINNDPMWKTALETNDILLEDMNDILTVGKIYDVIKQDEGIIYNDYFIEHDKGGRRWLCKSRFVTIDVWRDTQLNELGIKEEDSKLESSFSFAPQISVEQLLLHFSIF